jgi:uncharacterized protein YecE (DUF72 family)
VDRIATTWERGEDVYAYFNNDPGGAAVRDAVTFGRAAERAGLRVTRIPEPASLR